MYISKNDLKFITCMNRKYKNYNVNFQYFDDYILWLFYELYGGKEELYYSQLEKDIKEYSEKQSGNGRKDSYLWKEEREHNIENNKD